MVLLDNKICMQTMTSFVRSTLHCVFYLPVEWLHGQQKFKLETQIIVNQSGLDKAFHWCFQEVELVQ